MCAVDHPVFDIMSFRFILDAMIAFLAMGITEAILKPLAKALIDRQLRRALPYIYKRLDNEMPLLLQKATPEVMSAHIASTIAQATGQPATARQIEQVVQFYDPIKAVARNVNL